MEETVQPINPQPVTPPPTPSSSRNLVSIAVVAIVAAILASLGTYMYMSSQQNKQSQMTNQQSISPTQTVEATPTTASDVTESWQTYSGKTFTLKYPTGWQVEKDTNPALVSFLPEGKTASDVMTKQGYMISTYVEENPQQLTAEQYWSKRVKEGTRNPKSEKVIYGGIEGVKVTETKLDAHDITVIFARGDKLVLVSLNYFANPIEVGKQKNPDAENIFDQILTTFKLN